MPTPSWIVYLVSGPKTRKVYTATAEGVADASKRILTSVSPFYANTFTPDTFAVLTYAPAR